MLLSKIELSHRCSWLYMGWSRQVYTYPKVKPGIISATIWQLWRIEFLSREVNDFSNTIRSHKRKCIRNIEEATMHQSLESWLHFLVSRFPVNLDLWWEFQLICPIEAIACPPSGLNPRAPARKADPGLPNRFWQIDLRDESSEHHAIMYWNINHRDNGKTQVL